MSLAEPLFDTGLGEGGPTFTPIQPGATVQPAPVPVRPPVPVVPTPATTVVLPPVPPAPVPTPRAAPTSLPAPVVAGTPRYSWTDYGVAGRALMPRGRVWPNDPDGAQSRLLRGIGRTLERLDAAASAILAGAVPGQLTPMLPEWEAALGLPDPCAGDAPTFDQRTQQVRGRFVNAGGQSRQRFIDYAAALGFTIEIETYSTASPGTALAGQTITPDQWPFVWGVRVTVNHGALLADVLMCELDALKPAESTLILLS